MWPLRGVAGAPGWRIEPRLAGLAAWRIFASIGRRLRDFSRLHSVARILLFTIENS